MTRDQFKTKFGDPATFSFRNQCYDGRTPTTPCLCGRKIRFCFIAWSGTGQKVTFGSCCFKHFSGTRLADILEAAQVCLLNNVVEAQKDAKRTADAKAFRESRKGWNQARREAIKRLAAHRRTTGKIWLPEPLFDVKMSLTAPQPAYKQSSKATAWFLAKATYIKEKLEAADRVSGTMGHEIAVAHKN